MKYKQAVDFNVTLTCLHKKHISRWFQVQMRAKDNVLVLTIKTQDIFSRTTLTIQQLFALICMAFEIRKWKQFTSF